MNSKFIFSLQFGAKSNYIDYISLFKAFEVLSAVISISQQLLLKVAHPNKFSIRNRFLYSGNLFFDIACWKVIYALIGYQKQRQSNVQLREQPLVSGGSLRAKLWKIRSVQVDFVQLKMSFQIILFTKARVFGTRPHRDILEINFITFEFLNI